MKWLRRLVTFLVALPNDLLVGWPAILLIRLFWGEHLRWEDEALVCQLRKDSWPARSWYRHKVDGKYEKRADGSWRTWGATTLGHAIFYGPGHALRGAPEHYLRIQRHEHVHVEQCEEAMLRSFLAGVAVAIATHHHVLAAAIWTFGYIAMGTCGWAVAWLRGENPYRGSQHEESAYAQEDSK